MSAPTPVRRLLDAATSAAARQIEHHQSGTDDTRRAMSDRITARALLSAGRTLAGQAETHVDADRLDAVLAAAERGDHRSVELLADALVLDAQLRMATDMAARNAAWQAAQRARDQRLIADRAAEDTKLPRRFLARIGVRR
ncbi:hypothetical protein [Actinoalloteichus sp. GBA129-24]|uniref:hypothetical protein n=1 Tax=Actinoalloteichus sp. GBA129-24 TaxID=1612551 RepID=UPI00095045FF|nr:hypothetical protein [Actinoalloteichus sp. GBA129-24]APU20983.1 hypothetical protein UA75_14865 [Actinoalloteichus sp. GBA129-24]APU24232.1 hypothetical protein UA75_31345 [Actinoalloteichus sp. GBA129-24]